MGLFFLRESFVRKTKRNLARIKYIYLVYDNSCWRCTWANSFLVFWALPAIHPLWSHILSLLGYELLLDSLVSYLKDSICVAVVQLILCKATVACWNLVHMSKLIYLYRSIGGLNKESDKFIEKYSALVTA